MAHMAITPQNDYPDDWESIAQDIKKRAGFTCEHCGSPSVPGRILTVHHLTGDKSDCRYVNLVALCQKCHLHVQARWVPGGIIPAEWGEVPEWIQQRGLSYRLVSLQLEMF
jgi:5-methylcytosine-specific restriction endonuclease McrA